MGALKASRVPLDELSVTSVSPGRKGLRSIPQGSLQPGSQHLCLHNGENCTHSPRGKGDKGDAAPSLALGTHKGQACPGTRSHVPDREGLPGLAGLSLRSWPGPVSSITLPGSSPGGTGCEARGPQPGVCSPSQAPSLPGPTQARGGKGHQGGSPTRDQPTGVLMGKPRHGKCVFG